MCLTFYLYFYPSINPSSLYFFLLSPLVGIYLCIFFPFALFLFFILFSFICMLFYSQLLLFFIFLGANLTMKSTQGLDPLHTALRIRDWNLLFLLLHYGAGEFSFHFFIFFLFIFFYLFFSLFFLFLFFFSFFF